ncbi:MAG: putative ABC transporter permease subunit [Chitinophagales bacterium]
MSRFWALFKTLAINYFGISWSQLRAKNNRKQNLKRLALVLVVIAGLAPTLALYSKMLIMGFDLLAPVGQEGAILTLGIVMVSSLIFLFGIFYVINFFYFAEDAQSLLALPLKGWQVLGARFSIVLCYEYLTELPFLLPPILIYGIKSGASVFYWVFALLGFLLTPLVPLSLATIPTVIAMRFANLTRRKDLFRILGAIAVIGLVIAYQFMAQKVGPNMMDQEFLRNLFTSQNGLINLISRVLPSTRYLGLALVHANESAGVLNLLIFAALSFVVVALAWFTGEKLYFKGLVGSTEVTARRKALKSSDFKRQGKAMTAGRSYWTKEMRILLRTPTYFINCVLTSFLVPVILAIAFIFQPQNKGGGMPWINYLTMPKVQIVIMLVIVGIVLFLAGSNAITATAISREGKQLYVSKFIPVPHQEQMNAKLLSGYVFDVLGAILLIGTARIIMPLELLLVIALLAVSLVSIVPVIEIGLLIDIVRPKLVWDNEQQAFKQNLNVVFSMAAAVVLGAPILYGTYRLTHSPTTAAITMFACFGILAVLLYYVLVTWGIEQYRKLEG